MWSLWWPLLALTFIGFQWEDYQEKEKWSQSFKHKQRLGKMWAYNTIQSNLWTMDTLGPDQHKLCCFVLYREVVLLSNVKIWENQLFQTLKRVSFVEMFIIIPCPCPLSVFCYTCILFDTHVIQLHVLSWCCHSCTCTCTEMWDHPVVHDMYCILHVLYMYMYIKLSTENIYLSTFTVHVQCLSVLYPSSTIRGFGVFLS